jgi:hypothetical protein
MIYRSSTSFAVRPDFHGPLHLVSCLEGREASKAPKKKDNKKKAVEPANIRAVFTSNDGIIVCYIGFMDSG